MQSANDFLFVKKDVIEEKKSSGGIIISSVFHHKEEIMHKNICYATVVYGNENISFLKQGDRIVMNPQKGTYAALEYDDYTVIKKDQFLAKIDADGKFIVPPDSVMVKIKKEDTDSLYSKWIVRNDGTRVQLFTQPEPSSLLMRKSEIFVSIGEVIQVGGGIENVQEGDLALLDYTVDNFIDNVLYYDGEGNKFIAIDGNTTFHEETLIINADRKHPTETIVYKKGELNAASPLLGIIRGEKLIARNPYVFIEHEGNTVDKVSDVGILYSEKVEISERKILSVSDKSSIKYGMKDGQMIMVEEYNIFDVKTPTGIIQCIIDEDILIGMK